MDILYVESMQNYTKLHFKEKSIVIHQTMKAIEESLSAEHFSEFINRFNQHHSYRNDFRWAPVY